VDGAAGWEVASEVVSAVPDAAESFPMIEREMLEQMFANMAEQGVVDMNEPLLWGFFFTNATESPLRAAVPALQERGYEFVDVWQTEKDDPEDEDLWWLHVQRVEVHSVDSLFARNEQLYEFAARHGLDTYDGMDVGPVGKPEQ
jgi:hypothetical protein